VLTFERLECPIAASKRLEVGREKGLDTYGSLAKQTHKGGSGKMQECVVQCQLEPMIPQWPTRKGKERSRKFSLVDWHDDGGETQVETYYRDIIEGTKEERPEPNERSAQNRMLAQ